MGNTRIAKTRTGTQPTGNRRGLMGNGLSRENPVGMSAATVGTVIATGGGGGARASKRKMRRGRSR